MSFLQRAQTWFSAKMNHAMDNLENPEETLDYSYEKQLEALQQMRRSIADVMTSKERLNLQMTQVQQQQQKLQQQAQQALTAGREDLAREALTRSQTIGAQMDALQGQVATLEQQHQKLVDAEQRLSTKVEAFRTQKEMVKAQYHAAQSQVAINEQVSGLSEEFANVNLAMQHAQDKVLNMQARANALDSMLQSGELSDNLQLGSGGDDIQRQLDKVSAQSSVDAQLAAMKQQMGLPASGQSTASSDPAQVKVTEVPPEQQ